MTILEERRLSTHEYNALIDKGVSARRKAAALPLARLNGVFKSYTERQRHRHLMRAWAMDLRLAVTPSAFEKFLSMAKWHRNGSLPRGGQEIRKESR